VRAAFHLGFLPLDRVSRLVDPHRLLLSVAVVPRHNLRHLLEKDGVLVGDFVDASCEEKRVRFRSVVVLLSEESASPPALWLPVQRWVHTLLVEYFLGSCFEVRVDVWGAVIHGTRVVRVRARRHVGQRLVVRSQMHLDGLLVAGILHPDDPGQLSAVPTHKMKPTTTHPTTFSWRSPIHCVTPAAASSVLVAFVYRNGAGRAISLRSWCVLYHRDLWQLSGVGLPAGAVARMPFPPLFALTYYCTTVILTS